MKGITTQNIKHWKTKIFYRGQGWVGIFAFSFLGEGVCVEYELHTFRYLQNTYFYLNFS